MSRRLGNYTIHYCPKCKERYFIVNGQPDRHKCKKTIGDRIMRFFQTISWL